MSGSNGPPDGMRRIAAFTGRLCQARLAAMDYDHVDTTAGETPAEWPVTVQMAGPDSIDWDVDEGNWADPTA